jgi:hypothetical protein
LQLDRFANIKNLELLSLGINHLDPGEWFSPGDTHVMEKLIALPKMGGMT